MTAEEWLQVRDKIEMPMPIWYEYYLEKRGTLPYFQFEVRFVQILWNNTMIIKPDGSRKEITLETATHKIHEYYNKKFNL